MPVLGQTSSSSFKMAANVSDFRFIKRRVKVRSLSEDMPSKFSSVIYWMSRDQRVQENWAFLFAQRLALKNQVALRVVFCLVPSFMDATLRHYKFMMEGLQEVETECRELGIPFHLLLGRAVEVLPPFVREHGVGAVVTDYSPLRVPRQWVDDILEKLPKDIPLCQVDAHNIVPVWEASPKQEYAARTFRPKITNQLPTYLTEFPRLIAHPHNKGVDLGKKTDWTKVERSLRVDTSVGPVEWATGGTSHAMATLKSFCSDRLKFFSEARNDPNKDALSNLSPWLHFGHISAARCVLEVQKQKGTSHASVEAYVEECVVRRELSDNYCHYQPHYDSLKGASDWARITLDQHRKDKREKVYSLPQFDRAKTHDDLWNAAQVQLVTEGKLHGFLRMYWAKKILEWTPDPDTALATALYLNDRYSLDGRDPNGFVGCMWSVAGLHDQGWMERGVFGKIRYMNYNGCKRKFNVQAFENKYRARNNLPGASNVKEALEVVSTAGTVTKPPAPSLSATSGCDDDAVETPAKKRKPSIEPKKTKNKTAEQKKKKK